MYQEFGINKKIEKLAIETEEELKEEYKRIDENCTKNSIKVLKAFQENRVNEEVCIFTCVKSLFESADKDSFLSCKVGILLKHPVNIKLISKQRKLIFIFILIINPSL